MKVYILLLDYSYEGYGEPEKVWIGEKPSIDILTESVKNLILGATDSLAREWAESLLELGTARLSGYYVDIELQEMEAEKC
jgi:hypothetical protein